MNFYDRTVNFPPCLCRLLARHKGGKPKERDELVGWGLNHFQVDSISQLTDWDAVPLGQLFEFTHMCGTDFTNSDHMRAVDTYLRKKPTFLYLRKHPQWKTYYLPLLALWRDSVDDRTALWPPIKALLNRIKPTAK